MTDDVKLEELGRRAVACKHWRWMPGMLASNGEEDVRIFYTSANHLHLIEFEDDEFEMVRIPKNTCLIPDLSDPATLGCLLALVREAWPHEWHQFMVPIFDGISHWYMGCLMPGTSRIVMPTRVMKNGLLDALPPKPTEVEALVAALEAAP